MMVDSGQEQEAKGRQRRRGKVNLMTWRTGGRKGGGKIRDAVPPKPKEQRKAGKKPYHGFERGCMLTETRRR